jgi:hypothetical protein
MPITYTPIATYTVPSAAANYTFSSITGTYTDLVLVISAITSVGDRTLRFQFNGDTTSNYSMTNVLGYSGGAISQRISNNTSGYLSSSSDAVNPATYTTNIMNYANTTTYKTVLCRDSTSGSSSTAAALVNLWRATPAAITSITIFPNTGNFSVGSTFTLYGIKAA